MEKFTVIKLGMIQIPPSRTLSEYYSFKQKYEAGILKQRQKKVKEIDYKCPNCNNPQKLQFFSKDNFLYCVCQTTSCSSNMIIPIYKFTTYEEELESSKQQYQDAVQRILKEKFDILFSFKLGKDVPIDSIRSQYLMKKEYMHTIEQNYRYILQNPDIEERKKQAYDTRDKIADQLKQGFTKKLLVQLNEVLKTIHDLEYSMIHHYGKVEHVHSEYSLKDLELKRTRDSVEPVQPSAPSSDVTLTFTFKDSPHHVNKVSEHGLVLNDLTRAYQQCKQRGLDPRIIDLRELFPEAKEHAYLFVCEGWLNQSDSDLLLKENLHVEWGSSKKGDSVYYSEFQKDYKTGRVYTWKDVPRLASARNSLPQYFGEKAELPAEGNKYTIEAVTPFQGGDHKIHVALHVGSTQNLQYQWYKGNKPVGSLGGVNIPPGTLYALSEKATGHDSKKTSSYSLRHAIGNTLDINVDIHQLIDIQTTISESKVKKLVFDLLTALSSDDLALITSKRIRSQLEEENKIDLSKWKEFIKETATEFMNKDKTPEKPKAKPKKTEDESWYITFQSKKKEFRSLSNVYESPVTVQSLQYPSGEHAFHGEKFRRLGELAKGDKKEKLLNAAKEFLTTGTIEGPLNAKKQGIKLVDLNADELRLWDVISMEVQLEICKWKAAHNEQVQIDLKASEGKVLIHSESRPKLEDMGDRKWEGKALEDGKVAGKNELGNIWMKVRDSL